MAIASQNSLATQDSVAKSFGKAHYISTIFIPGDKFLKFGRTIKFV